MGHEDVLFEFQHPVEPGQTSGGWMEQWEDKPISAGFGKLIETIVEEKKSKVTPKIVNKEPNAAVFTMEEVENHDNENDCWIVVRDRVYDCTSYLKLHPGGKDSILLFAGQDCTEDFDAIHSDNATELLEKYYIGDLINGEKTNEEQKEDQAVDKAQKLIALNPKAKVRFPLHEKKILSSDSFLLDFALPTAAHTSGIPTGKHAFIYATINGKSVMRAYTPISSQDEQGHLRFVIKAYPPCEKFPKGGLMSQYLDSVNVGDFVEFRGPLGEIEYLSNGNFTFKGKSRKASYFNMVAGGTGITPCFQVAAEILSSTSDTTRISLIYGARTKKDLLLKRELDKWAKEYPSRFKVHYVLDQGHDTSRSYSKGYVTKELLSKHFFEASPEVFTLMCGPKPMIEKACVPNLVKLGHEETNIIEF